MFEKIADKFIKVYNFRIASSDHNDKAFLVYMLIQKIFDNSNYCVVSISRKASFDPVTTQYDPDKRFYIDWKIAAQKCDVDAIIEKASKVANSFDKKNPDLDQAITIWLNGTLIKTI